MGEFQTFATNVLRFSKKRGRAPMMNANKFYPRKEERELEDLVRAEFERSWRAALAVALNGWQDSVEEMLGMGSQLPEDFRKAIGETGEKIVNNAQNNLVKFSEMTIGTPYYPPNLEESVKKDWEATFQQLCISAETDAKARIARLVNEGKTQGMNKLQVEALVKKELPAETKHRAELISRTETAKLNNAATMATYESAGIRYYKWLASIDDRTRPTHAAMQGLICSVENPDVYYEETPDGLVEHDRGPDRYHGDPGTDYQCRCTSVPWDPRIDGKYQVKEAPEPEPKEPSKLEVAREETKKAEARAQKAEGSLSILQKAQSRHDNRTNEQRADIQRRWRERTVKWQVKHSLPDKVWETAKQACGDDYVTAVKSQLVDRSDDYRNACKLLKNDFISSSRNEAYYSGTENRVYIYMACGNKNKRGAGKTMLHEHGHALDSAIGLALGKGRKHGISVQIGLGEMIANELAGNLISEAEVFIKSLGKKPTHKLVEQYLKAKFLGMYNGDYDNKTPGFKPMKVKTPKLKDGIISPISDMVSGATKDAVCIKYHHTKKYWNEKESQYNVKHAGLGCEGFTHIGTLSETKEGRLFLETYMPDSYAKWQEVIKKAAAVATAKK